MAWKSRRGEGGVSCLYLQFYMIIYISCLAKTLFHPQFLSFVQCLYNLYILSTKIVILDKSPFIMWAVYNGNLIFMMNYFPRQIWPAWHEITFGWRERSLNGEHLYCPLPLLTIYTIYTPLRTFGISVLYLSMCIHTRFLLDIMWFDLFFYWLMYDGRFRDERKCC